MVAAKKKAIIMSFRLDSLVLTAARIAGSAVVCKDQKVRNKMATPLTFCFCFLFCFVFVCVFFTASKLVPFLRHDKCEHVSRPCELVFEADLYFYSVPDPVLLALDFREFKRFDRSR